MAESVCPPLGTGSVDLNALHDAARKSKDLTAALAAATTRAEALEEAPPAAEPATAASEDAGPTGPAQ